MNSRNLMKDGKATRNNQVFLEFSNPIISTLVVWGFCFFIATVYLLLCTKSSPLYPFNDWVDANAFFTMGKGMMNGKILYRDLFEQKGPLLYFIHGLAYLISSKSFLGVFIFELISFSIFLFYSYKSLSLFLNIRYSLIYLPIIASFILNLRSFSHGDSAEEFCLPLLAISLYILLKCFRIDDSKPVPSKWIFWNGIIAGCVLWIKFSLLGFWIGWIVCIFILMIVERHYLHAVKGCMLFLFGMMIASIPWIIYFGLNHSIFEWINTYIIFNLTIYPENSTFLSHLIAPLINIAYQISLNPVFGGLLWLGIVVFLSYRKFIRSRLHRFSLFFCILFLIFGIYGGGRAYFHYYLIVSPFINFGIIVLQDLINSTIHKMISMKSTVIVILVTLLATILLTLQFNQNTYLLKFKKEDLVQFNFASIINQSENATLLNYGALDLGFYTTTGITPNTRFFEKQNISYNEFPLNMDEQNRYIKEKVVKYIVLIRPDANNIENLEIPYLNENYELIATEEQEYENNEYYYHLFKLVK